MLKSNSLRMIDAPETRVGQEGRDRGLAVNLFTMCGSIQSNSHYPIFLHKSSSGVKIRMYAKNQPPVTPKVGFDFRSKMLHSD